MIGKIQDLILESAIIHNKLLDINICNKIYQATNICIIAINSGNSIYFCGNGGSFSDAAHLAAELSGKFYYDRKPLPSEVLGANNSYLTAVANDFGYEFVYSRLIKAFGKPGDVLVGLSTSGKSKNVLNAFAEAKSLNLYTIGFTGENGFADEDSCDIVIKVPSNDTPKIQCGHLLIGHIICQLIEEEVINADKF